MNLEGKKDEIIEIKEAVITLRSDGIIQVTYKDNIVITVELQERLYVIFNKICQDKKRPFLFSAFDHVIVSSEARANAIEMEDRFPGCATAVLANTLAYKLVANFYLKVHRPKTPYKVFSNKEEAIKWLLTFVG